MKLLYDMEQSHILRYYIKNKVSNNKKVILHEFEKDITNNIFEVIDRKFVKKDLEIIKDEVDKEIERYLEDFGYLTP